jgi:hypothetical protein
LVNAFEATLAETTTMLPVITAFMAAHRLKEVVIVADAGMIFREEHQGHRGPGPVVHPRNEDPRGPARDQPMAAGASGRADPGRAGVRSAGPGQINGPAQRPGALLPGTNTIGPAGPSRASTSRSTKPSRPSPARPRSSATGSSRSPAPPRTVNRELEAKARALAGTKGYVTNIADPTPEQVIEAYHQLFQIEKSFRMAKSDLAARPIYHRTKDSIEAHLTIVFAALAVSR